jgi:hypothetical protein
MDAAQRIRTRNTAYVQIAAAIGCLLVAAFLVYVDTLPVLPAERAIQGRNGGFGRLVRCNARLARMRRRGNRPTTIW